MANVPFIMHPRLITTLGEELVQKDERALIELVKNSYDADATECWITWSDATSMLTVRDNGHGMTLAGLKSTWFTMGTPIKLAKKTSPKLKRRLAGSKGLGRLSLASLGVETIVETGTAEDDWRRFTFNLSEIEKIAEREIPKIPVAKIPKPKDAVGPTGTILRIKRGSQRKSLVPSRSAHDEFVRALQLLIHPRFDEERPGDRFDIWFKSHLEARDEAVGRVDVSTPTPYRCTASVASDKTATVAVEVSTDLYKGPGKVEEYSNPSLLGSWGDIVGSSCEILWRPRGAEETTLGYWKEAAASALGEATGFHVYRDLVRVQPYGDDDSDWLRMEAKYVRRGSRERFVRPLQVFAWVNISSTQDFVDNPSREGLRSTPAFKALKKFCEACLDEIRDVRKVLEPAKEKSVPVATERRQQRAKQAVKKITKMAETDEELKKEVAHIEYLVSSSQEQQDRLALYRERTTAGLVASLVLHDSGISLGDQLNMIRLADQAQCNRPTHHRLFNSLHPMVSRIVEGYALLRGAARRQGHRSSQFDAANTALELKAHFENVLDRTISIECNPETAWVHMREADLWSVLVNLLHNAITSGDYEHREGRTYNKDGRKILLEINMIDRDLEIVVEDDGPGLPHKPPHWIWEPGNSMRVGGGSGLGLWIVSDIASGWGGSVAAEDAQTFASGARITAIFPGVGSK